ncbi:PREDICTED: beta-galactosidase 13-like [Ipomoea nil]|uniref:beta-galactosidase 13-like n=1 Tax=Ipomoea nil TaxID=35883 RepID=UPI0009019AB3|nr:PREDICTED: beta-galactosidase 13-like [Ipomoea nil]
MGTASCVLVVGLLWMLAASTVVGKGNKTHVVKTVTYDKTSIIINGAREIFFSGSVHYPRMPPEEWPNIIRKAKEGGLNVIQTYVFWDIHEPVEGQFNFEGNNDVVKFIKMIGDMGLYVTLRVGPYLEAEWNLGGFPYWLKEVPGIVWRTYNEPYMKHMKRFVEMIVNMMKKEKLFAPQGGPIIMAQIENEYSSVEASYREMGVKYVHWAAEMAVGAYKEIPWIMCKQKTAPPIVITTCNGRHCADTFNGTNGPNKPLLWTENWTAQYRVFGDPPGQRSAEDISFSVVRFYSKSGTYVNYYMYFGGNNFGMTGSSFVSTAYYDEGPMDIYGFNRDPKWSHLRDTHRALKLCKKPLLWGTANLNKINGDHEITTFENTDLKLCAAFLSNNNTLKPTTLNFRGTDYYLPAKSVSILPDCKNMIFNTQHILAQHNHRTFDPSKVAGNLKWEMFQESIPTIDTLPAKSPAPKEMYTLTKHTTDYVWFSTRVVMNKRDLPMRPDIHPVLFVESMGHAMIVFINGEFAGYNHGNNVAKEFILLQPVNLKPGTNDITFLCSILSYPNSGAWMERRYAGPKSVLLLALMTGNQDITKNSWSYSIGTQGEKLKLFTEEGAEKAKWGPVTGNHNTRRATWYKTHFDLPEGNDPIAVNMEKMSKGMVWVNGKSIGRYWVSFLTPLGQPTQTEYHIPRPWLKPKNNLLVVFEEFGGDPDSIKVMLVNRDTICSSVAENYPPDVKIWERKGDEFRATTDDLKPRMHLTCPDAKVMKKIEFASYGNPEGVCGNFMTGSCSFPNAIKIVEKACLGKTECEVPVEKSLFVEGKDLCPKIVKTLAVQAKCVRQGKED